MIGISTTPLFCRHFADPYHPERPERINAIFQAVRAAGLVNSPNPLSNITEKIGPIAQAGFTMREMTPAPADEKWIELVHPRAHIENIRRICQERGLEIEDTPVCPESFEIALLSAGAVLQCCDEVVEGNLRRAFAAVRPPGHHAEPNKAMGFCLFSNIAIAARYLQKRHGVGKVAVVDFDVHHGNGTQAALEGDPSMLFISLHQDPRTLYPGTGFEWEIGVGAAKGLTLNIPMAPGSEDTDYYKAFDEKVLPKIDQFKPEFLLISAGFDAHRADPLASINLSDEAFAQMTRRLVGASEAHCQGRVVSALEGGYNLPAMARGVIQHLVEFRD
ncbi:MAG: histone deacetylase [Tepidisphaeraceae bacterium]|jgi:acetoin utilization deacetylase AcuC-like enzyme